MPDTPMTKAGQALVDEWQDISEMWDLERRVLAIEREARAEALRRVEAAVLAIADEIDAEAREWDSGTLESFAVRLRAALVIRDTPPEET